MYMNDCGQMQNVAFLKLFIWFKSFCQFDDCKRVFNYFKGFFMPLTTQHSADVCVYFKATQNGFMDFFGVRKSSFAAGRRERMKNGAKIGDVVFCTKSIFCLAFESGHTIRLCWCLKSEINENWLNKNYNLHKLWTNEAINDSESIAPWKRVCRCTYASQSVLRKSKLKFASHFILHPFFFISSVLPLILLLVRSHRYVHVRHTAVYKDIHTYIYNKWNCWILWTISAFL